MAHPLLLSEAFGVRDYARIFSSSNLLATAGTASGPALLGVLRDATGSYAVSFGAAFAVSLAAAAVLVVLARPAAGAAAAPGVAA